MKEEENERKKSALKEKDSKKVPSRPAKPTAAKPTAVKPTVVKPTAFKQSVKRPTATSSRVPASKINPGASSSKVWVDKTVFKVLRESLTSFIFEIFSQIFPFQQIMINLISNTKSW